MKHLTVVSRQNSVQPAQLESAVLAAANALKKADPKVRRLE